MNIREIDFSRIIYIAQAFSNDLKYMYLHSAGQSFDNIRTICKELQSELESEVEEMSVLAITNGTEVDNPSNIKTSISFDTDWSEIKCQIIDSDLFIKELKFRGMVYITELQRSLLPPEYKDLYLKFWRNEILFKNEMRGLGSVTSDKIASIPLSQVSLGKELSIV